MPPDLTAPWLALLRADFATSVPDAVASLPEAILAAARGGDEEPVTWAADALGKHRARVHNTAATVVEDVQAIRSLINQEVPRKERKALDDQRLTQVLERAVRDAVSAWVDESNKVASHRVTRDPVTGLFNRAMFTEELRRLAAGAHRSGMPALLLADVDHFRPVNEKFGHMVGDEILARIGQALLEAARAEDVVARIDGGQFAILIQGRVEQDQAIAIGERLLAVVRADERLSELPTQVSVSVGVGWTPEVTDSVDLLSMAQQAMQRAKSQGGGRVEVLTEVSHHGPFLSVVA